MTLIYIHEVTFVSGMDRRIYPGVCNPRTPPTYPSPDTQRRPPGRLLYPAADPSIGIEKDYSSPSSLQSAHVYF
ncbi:hypothetical protein MTP99_011586 [Tenebrio molitor]|nr:hypothetical protein MTP99_011586 [Tenebrio molitor]